MSKSIEITIKCQACDNEIEVESYNADVYGDLVLEVLPCPHCLDKDD